MLFTIILDLSYPIYLSCSLCNLQFSPPQGSYVTCSLDAEGRVKKIKGKNKHWTENKVLKSSIKCFQLDLSPILKPETCNTHILYFKKTTTFLSCVSK